MPIYEYKCENCGLEFEEMPLFPGGEWAGTVHSRQVVCTGGVSFPEHVYPAENA